MTRAAPRIAHVLAAASWLALAPLVAAPRILAQGGAHDGALSGAMGSPRIDRPAPTVRPRALRVCADPNNMPFSDRAGDGFENHIATLIARELRLPLEYTWWAQRRGFIRSTLGAQLCDVVIGITAGDDQVATTEPYYRSTYVFVSRTDRGTRIASFDDPRLQHMRVGIHVIGADYNSLPPGLAMAQRGLVTNVVGYSIYGNYAAPSPPSKLIEAVADGEVDLAVAWGPLAGYYAPRARVPVTMTPVANPFATRGIPFAYDIAMGVRRADTAFRARLDRIITRNRPAIEHILRSFGVPMVPATSTLSTALSYRTARRCVRGAEERTCA